SASGNSIEVEDKTRELRIGQGVTLYRNIGRVDGISSEVVIPLWQANVVEAEKGKVKLDLVLPLADKGVGASGGDMIIVDAVSAASGAEQSETSVAYCINFPAKLGTVDFNDFNVISRSFGYRLPYTLYDNDSAFSAIVHEALRDGGFKDTLKLGKVDTSGRCLQPVHKAAIDKNNCNQGVCAHEVSMVAGYQLFVGQEKKGTSASKTTIKTENCRQENQTHVIQSDLSKNALGVLKDTILKLRYQ
ncbi:MAG: hypothetical protein WCP33_00940, partial [Deltaproteobacteria bacterium]